MATAEHSERSLALLDSPPYRAILTLAMPTVIAMLSQSAVNEIDVVFFSRLPCPESSNAQAALLPSLILVWLFGGSLSAISVGTQAVTARRFAERDYKAAGAVLTNAAAFCIIAGLVTSLVGVFTIKGLLGTMIKVPEVREIAVDYSSWRLFGVISMCMTSAVKSFFDGIGKTWVHLVAALIMNVFNVLFCWMFIFGNLGAPRMGAPGAGLSAFISTWIGLAIVLFFASRERKAYEPAHLGNLSKKITWDLLKLSLPAAAATIIMMVGFGMFSRVAGRLDALESASQVAGKCGVEAVNGAATTNIVAILKLTFTACIAFGTATATLVSQSLGAKRPDDATKFGWASVRLGFLIFGLIGLAEGLLFTPQIVGFITHSPAVYNATLVPMRIMGLVTPVIAVALILSEALFGAGSTKFVALAQLVLIFLVLVPLSWIISIQMGVGLMGMWIAAVFYSIGAAITMSVKFGRGSWKKIVI